MIVEDQNLQARHHQVDTEFKFIKPGETRVRIAPSPTRPLHIGTARTSLLNNISKIAENLLKRRITLF